MVDDFKSSVLPVWSRSPLSALAALWATLLILVSLIEYPIYLHDPRVPLWKPLTLAGLPTCALVIWLIGELRGGRYLRLPLEPARPWFLYQLRRLPLLIAGYVLVVAGVRSGLFFQDDPLDQPSRFSFEIFKSALFYCLWLGLVYGTLSLIYLREKSAQLGFIQKALAESQLAQLRARLRPHFLFNSLNTISSLMQTDVRRADRMLTQLGDLLRASLGADDANLVALREELGLLHLYAEIMQQRFSDRVTFEWRIDDDALRALVPSMLLQPLLENAFKYGIERTTGLQHIRVTASCRPGQLLIQISNSGSSLAPDWRPGVGITNCQERLRILYGPGASVTLASAPDAGVAASVVLPLGASLG